MKQEEQGLRGFGEVDLLRFRFHHAQLGRRHCLAAEGLGRADLEAPMHTAGSSVRRRGPHPVSRYLPAPVSKPRQRAQPPPWRRAGET
ncbi:MAG: hypothetical protein WBL65_14485, partial [Bryobacteraceae bacterium]